MSDGTKTADTSTPVPCIDTAPVVTDDTYEMTADQTLDVSATGVLANDSDPEGQPITVGTPRPVSGPSNGIPDAQRGRLLRVHANRRIYRH